MRGTQPNSLQTDYLPRIIPAHAGNTGGRGKLAVHQQDHPRACGEHGSACRAGVGVQGSSPRMRGTLRRGNDKGHADGIIPAHAGNTGAPANDARAAWDHPRACGEHSMTLTLSSPSRGSSPRMRGTRIFFVFFLLSVGIIPAHAGNTVSAWPVFDSIRDHPRACGEHEDMPLHCDELTGSSPRMRGTLVGGTEDTEHGGIIPAHAGNTQ